MSTSSTEINASISSRRPERVIMPLTCPDVICEHRARNRPSELDLYQHDHHPNFPEEIRPW
ncbi:MAG: hypothetical protein ABIQ18_28530 [Umezawaea sp.]